MAFLKSALNVVRKEEPSYTLVEDGEHLQIPRRARYWHGWVTVLALTALLLCNIMLSLFIVSRRQFCFPTDFLGQLNCKYFTA